MEFVIGGELGVVQGDGEIVGQGPLSQDRSFVRPAPGNISNRVAAAPEHQNGQAEGMDEPDAIAVPADTQIKAAQSIASERIRAPLQDDCGRLECFDSRRDNRLENVRVPGVIDAGPQGHVNRIVAAALRADLVDIPGPGEEPIAVLVKRQGHDPTVPVEGFLDAVPVMHVNVNVEDAGVIREQLEDREDNVVDVAEPGSPCTFSVMQSPRPVDGDAVGRSEGQFPGPRQAAARVKTDEAGEPGKSRTIRREIESIQRSQGGRVLHLLGQFALVIYSPAHPVDEGDVVGRVEFEEISRGSRGGHGAVHVLIEAVASHERIRQGESLRFHGVGGAVMEIGNVRVVEIGDPMAPFPK